MEWWSDETWKCLTQRAQGTRRVKGKRAERGKLYQNFTVSLPFLQKRWSSGTGNLGTAFRGRKNGVRKMPFESTSEYLRVLLSTSSTQTFDKPAEWSNGVAECWSAGAERSTKAIDKGCRQSFPRAPFLPPGERVTRRNSVTSSVKPGDFVCFQGVTQGVTVSALTR